MKLLSSLFPNANILLCTFDVVKYLKQKIANEKLDQSEKLELTQCINKMIYANSEQSFIAHLTHFNEIASESFAEYFYKN